MIDKVKIAARMVLTEIPIEITFEVDNIDWITSDEERQCDMIWQKLRESHPMSARIAMHNTKAHLFSTWIENIRVIE